MNVMRRLPKSALITNALALMASTIGSGVLGLAFWVTAAHLYSANDVGRASSEVAAITLVAGLGQICLVSMFARFLPVARRRAGQIVRRGYAASLTATWILACGFVALRFGGRFLDRDVQSIAIFVISIMVFAVFALQDVVLTAFRRAPWVLTENILVAVARLALLPALLIFGRRFGVLGSWAVPMCFAVMIVNWLAFTKLIPAKEASGDDRGLLPTRRELVSYGSAQFIGGVIGNVAGMLPPVLVAAKLGTTAAAIFYFPWLFLTSCMALLWNIVFSLVVEAVHDTSRTRHLLNRAAAMGAIVTVGGGLILGFGAPLILSVVGSQYRQSGTVLLQLVALSLPFVGIGSLYGALTLINRKTWFATILDACGTAIFIIGGVLAIPKYGVSAFGLSFLFSQVTVALLSMPGIMRRYRQLAVPDPSIVLRLDREAQTMAAETQLIYPLFVARSAARESLNGLARTSGGLTKIMDVTFRLPSQFAKPPAMTSPDDDDLNRAGDVGAAGALEDDGEPTVRVESDEPAVRAESDEPTVRAESDDPTMLIDLDDPTVRVDRKSSAIPVAPDASEIIPPDDGEL